MAEHAEFDDGAAVQDRDLLQRLTLYFDELEERLRRGQGWFIFNASQGRSDRISNFIVQRLVERGPSVQAHIMVRRDFAISAYVDEVGLSALQPADGGRHVDDRAKREFELAQKVTSTTREQLLFSDVLVLTGLRPRARHEATYLDRAIAERYRRRLATILLTPEMPNVRQAEFASLDPSEAFWPRLFQRMYDTSLVAL
ncbi:MAG: hypothetical protein ACR2OO_06340 [Thermomicrobiales bacterium]